MKNKNHLDIQHSFSFGAWVLGLVPTSGVAGGAGVAFPSAGFCPFGSCPRAY